LDVNVAVRVSKLNLNLFFSRFPSIFQQFGELVDHVSDDAVPSLILNYKSRKEAEVALLKGRSFGDRLLSITWFTNQPLGTTRSGR